MNCVAETVGSLKSMTNSDSALSDISTEILSVGMSKCSSWIFKDLWFLSEVQAWVLSIRKTCVNHCKQNSCCGGVGLGEWWK